MVQLPYYKEQFADAPVPWSYQPTTAGGVPSGTGSSGEWASRETVMTSFRTRPKTEHVEDVLDQTADPYAYFLQTVSRQRFEQNLKDRGYDSTVTHPDRGHTLDLVNFEPKGSYMTGHLHEKYGTFASDSNIVNMLPALSTAFNNGGPFVGTLFTPATFPASDLPAFAQKAYSRVAPTYESFNLGRALAELKELPRVKLDFLSKSIGEWRFQGDRWIQKGANRLGDDTLNIMFGWIPLMNDVIGLCKALVSITNGMLEEPSISAPIHRTFRGPVNAQTSSESAQTTKMSWAPNSFITNTALKRVGTSGTATGPIVDYTASKRLVRRQWFEGSFTKFLPLGFDAKNYLDRAEVLLNVELTPLTMWQLTPWTWLSDWYVDISSTIAANQAASDKSLISHYAYAMEETTATIYLDYRIAPNSSIHTWTSSQPRDGHFMTTTTWKRRLRANPFGFMPGGPAGLNPYRTAVLAALGLSRL